MRCKPRRLSRRNDHGVVMVEAVIVTPIVMLFLFFILEYGIVFKDYTSVGNAGTYASRAGAAAGDDTNADWQILQAINDNSAALARGDIQRIVVYSATDTDDTINSVAPLCRTSATSIAGTCNIYRAADLTAPVSRFGCDAVTDLDLAFCPSLRSTTLSPPAGPPSYIGIYIEYETSTLTNFFRRTFTFRSDSVTRLEPRRYS